MPVEARAGWRRGPDGGAGQALVAGAVGKQGTAGSGGKASIRYWWGRVGAWNRVQGTDHDGAR